MSVHTLIAILLVGFIAAVAVGPLALARYVTVRKHREQFRATGATAFNLPSARDVENATWHEPTTALPTVPTPAAAVLDTTTGEMVRLGVDGLPLSEADIAARTAPTVLTVDPDRLTMILQLEKTSEYPLNAGTWAEITAAELFMLDPLGSCVLPPLPLTEEAGNPSMRDAFRHLIDKGRLTYDWEAGASEFEPWGYELVGAGV